MNDTRWQQCLDVEGSCSGQVTTSDDASAGGAESGEATASSLCDVGATGDRQAAPLSEVGVDRGLSYRGREKTTSSS